jgi:thymidylate synthase
MHILSVRNVHEVLPKAVDLLNIYGQGRNSRNGEVLVAPWPVITEYSHPWERVIFWPKRDANPFFHLYESLWMLAGRNDIQPLVYYVKEMTNFSDDGETLHGAYGHRWRQFPQFDLHRYITAARHQQPIDQLAIIAKRLQEDPNDRRCVLQMWDVIRDLGKEGKDFPCNTIATFQIVNGALELTVFCRSNDIIWGAYGANAVQFSMLQEYMAAWIQCPIGPYRQISVNWHAYTKNFDIVQGLDSSAPNPYTTVKSLVLIDEPNGDYMRQLDFEIFTLLQLDHLDDRSYKYTLPFSAMAAEVLRAYFYFKRMGAPEKYDIGIHLLSQSVFKNVDWVVAAREWLERRKATWEAKMLLA